MQVLPAIDLMGRQVVRGVGGQRANYRPIQSHWTDSSQPRDVAAALAARFGLSTAYIADLDAIAGGSYDVPSYEQVAAEGWQLWIDAGTGDRQRAEQFMAATGHLDAVRGIVVGLESLASAKELGALLQQFGRERAIFSLDMKAGRLLARIDAWSAAAPQEVIRVVVDAGFRRLILLDLADVGAGQGTTTGELCRETKRRYPEIEVTVGGGVRNRHDLQRLRDAGCDAVLVASALHDGTLLPQELLPV